MSSDDVMEWVHGFSKESRSATLVVPKRDSESTYFLFGRNRDFSQSWLVDGVPESIFAKAASAPLIDNKGMPIWFPPERGQWELLWGLISAPDFNIDEPLRSLVDHGSFLSYEFYRLLWEARFLTTENLNLNKAQAVVHATTRWIGGKPLTDADREQFNALDLRGAPLSSAQRYDLLCMLFTLLHQNDRVRNHVFSFASLEQAFDNPTLIRELELFLASLDRWIRMGSCPIGVLLGIDETFENMERLRAISPKLARRIELGLENAC